MSRVDTQPNILFFLSDDHAAHAIGAYNAAGLGPELMATPNIDRVAAEGMRADNCFCNNAICTPSRASILTGQYPHTCDVRTLHDVLDNRRDCQLQKLLRSGGYRTAIFGKWHLGAGPHSDPAGFDEWSVLVDQGVYTDPVFYTGSSAGRRGELRTTGHCTDVTTDMALDFLRRHAQEQTGRPFFCCVNHKAPHRPWEPGPEEADLFAEVVLPEPATLWDDYAGRPAAAAARMRIDRDLLPVDVKGTPPAGLSPQQRKRWYYDRYVKDYLRCCAGVDKSVGQLIAQLEATGQLDNTIIVYSSDQGFFLGDHGWYDKRFIYEQALRMPLLVRGPGIAHGSTDALLTNVDFAPTLLELAGVEPHHEMQGTSFAQLLRGTPEPADWQDAIYYRYWMNGDHTHHTTAHYGIRTKTHKLAYFYADPLDATGSGDVNTGVDPYWELYDLTLDPEEVHNLHGSPGTEQITRELEIKLRDLQTRTRDVPCG